jgi:predicted LPLAT superfamily acyltransferase
VLIGTTPFYGLHTLIIVIVALLARLNVFFMWIGTQISLPFLIPLLIIGTKNIYKSIYKSEIEIIDYTQVLQLGSRWILSSLVLGLILGGLTTILSYFFQAYMGKSKTSEQKWGKSSRSQFGIWFVQKLMQAAGIKTAYAFLYLVVPFYFLNPRIRSATSEFWKTIRPQMNFFERQKQMFRQLLCFAQNLVDRAYQRSSKKYALQVSKDPSLDSFFSYLEAPQSRSCILVSTHFGGWELAMTAFDKLGIKKRMLVVMYQSEYAQNHESTELNARDNFEIIYFNKSNFSIFKIKEYLSRGDIVGLMGDRPVGRSFELISLFGKLSVLDSTAFRLAEMFGSEIFYLYCVKEDVLKYKIGAVRSAWSQRYPQNIIELGEDISTEVREENLITHMQEYAESLEFHVNQYPEQWMNFYPFFSTPPSLISSPHSKLG